MEFILKPDHRNDIEVYPTPHLVVPSAIDKSFGQTLLEEFPPEESFGIPDQLRKQRANIFAIANEDLYSLPTAGDTLKCFCRNHASKAFLELFLGIFEDQIKSIYPNLSLDYVREKGRISAKVNLSIANPEIPTRARGAHLDNPSTLFAMLLYLRDPIDHLEGGDFELYDFNKKFKSFPIRGRDLPDSVVRLVKTVPYRANTVVIFINSIRALHGVSLRQPGGTPRRTISFALHLPDALFPLKRARSPLQRIRVVGIRGLRGIRRYLRR